MPSDLVLPRGWPVAVNLPNSHLSSFYVNGVGFLFLFLLFCRSDLRSEAQRVSLSAFPCPDLVSGM